jgi:putative ABC transport system substrate-binding protein
MRRREFITLIGSGAAAALPILARAQRSDGPRSLGVLMPLAETDQLARPWVGALREELERLGWQVDRNLRIDYRWTAGSLERMRASAAELVNLTPDVLLAGNTPTTAALQHETRRIPIVFVLVGDPIGDRFVASLPHPGGNITGFLDSEPTMVGKQLELLKEIAPAVRRVAFIFNPDVGRYIVSRLRAAEASGSSLGLEIAAVPVHDKAEIESAIATWGRQASVGLYVAPDITTVVNRDLIAALAAQHRLPAVYPYGFFAVSGGLASYGTEIADHYRLAAGYVDRLFKGVRPDELPVQAPTHFKLVINLKTARVLGLDVPPLLLSRADEVIE